MHRRLVLMLLSIAATVAVAPSPVSAAGERGHFGFSVKVAGQGPFYETTLDTVHVVMVTPGLPAAQAGLLAGDQILAVGDRPLAGMRAHELDAMLDKAPGERLELRVRRADGKEVTIAMTAAGAGDLPVSVPPAATDPG